MIESDVNSRLLVHPSSVIKFFLVQQTKVGEKYTRQVTTKYPVATKYQIAMKFSRWRKSKTLKSITFAHAPCKIDQQFPCKGHLEITKTSNFGIQMNHLATLTATGKGYTQTQIVFHPFPICLVAPVFRGKKSRSYPIANTRMTALLQSKHFQCSTLVSMDAACVRLRICVQIRKWGSSAARRLLL
jgi:hypothetical protein